MQQHRPSNNHQLHRKLTDCVCERALQTRSYTKQHQLNTNNTAAMITINRTSIMSRKLLNLNLFSHLFK